MQPMVFLVSCWSLIAFELDNPFPYFSNNSILDSTWEFSVSISYALRVQIYVQVPWFNNFDFGPDNQSSQG